jgi:hypothetical protein
LIDELDVFEPEPLTVERMSALVAEEEFMLELAMDGQFGFQMMMMHPEGHVQMVTDLMNLVKYWLKYQYPETTENVHQ